MHLTKNAQWFLLFSRPTVLAPSLSRTNRRCFVNKAATPHGTVVSSHIHPRAFPFTSHESRTPATDETPNSAAAAVRFQNSEQFNRRDPECSSAFRINKANSLQAHTYTHVHTFAGPYTPPTPPRCCRMIMFLPLYFSNSPLLHVTYTQSEGGGMGKKNKQTHTLSLTSRASLFHTWAFGVRGDALSEFFVCGSLNPSELWG